MLLLLASARFSVLKLQIQEFLETGTVSELSGVDDLAGVGRAAPQLKDTGKDMANKFM